MNKRYFFSTETDRVDRARVHEWLSEQSYWAQGRVREKQDAAIDASRNYGVYDIETGEQVAYGRVVTDGVTFAWLCDVFVLAEARGQGVGKMLAAGVVADLEPAGPGSGSDVEVDTFQTIKQTSPGDRVTAQRLWERP